MANISIRKKNPLEKTIKFPGGIPNQKQEQCIKTILKNQ
jgi:hypothetical protein